MFGLIIPNYKSLNDDEKSRYQSVYCGLCHSLRDNYSNISRLALSFDLTFLVLLLSSLYEPEEKTENCNCIFHPGNKFETSQSKISDYCADITVALAYHKILDDINDENKLSAKISEAALKKQYTKVQTKLPQTCKHIETIMNKINKQEHENSNKEVGDEISMLFGIIMAEIFNPYDDNWSETLMKIGANIGRLIYFMDAAIDYEKDLKNNQFNPYKILNNNKEKITAEDANQIKDNLSIFAGQATTEFEKLPLEQDLHILQNILYEGLWIQFNHHFFSNQK